MHIRPATPDDHDALWGILEPVIRAGETYPLPRDMTREDALAYWLSPAHEVHVAVYRDDERKTARRKSDGRKSDGPRTESREAVVGTYYLKANTAGGGDHVANCGYMVAPAAAGRGVAQAMCADSLARARARGFRAMQFNFVISSNVRAVRLWQHMGFEIVGRLPGAFRHPTLGFVDALVMVREL
ncbi:GNAT family N-acetyltransferase [Rhodoplanes serenus]|uniref:GNAT family N-acetyltransferase n=1 Tax=Rhodoplanes serenus TaxID=200615 RepID=A0A9X4XL98_9BRAD|nr:GNAT family N-acetyltransferase [Rhodoplanes serenus]MTW17258.1 GNAT family N-acetyltransferase [Rhodoplanes serenus]